MTTLPDDVRAQPASRTLCARRVVFLIEHERACGQAYG
jgi:hypothetical protein